MEPTPPGYAVAWERATPEMRGILLMCGSTLCFALMHAMIRHASAELPPLVIAFFRNVLGLLVFAPIFLSQGFGFLRTKRIGLHAFRSLLNAGAMLMFFSALAITPIAHVTALGFSAPIFAAVLSVVLLGEKIRARRWTAIIIGFVGVLVILRPGMIPIDAGSALVLASAVLWAIVLMIIRVMGRTESSMTITAYMNLFLSLFSFGPALWVWVWPSAEGWIWLVLIGFTGTVAQIGLSQAMKETEPTVVMPFDFLRLIWVAALGWVAFGEVPDRFVWIGGAIIFSSGFYLAWRERQNARRVNQK